MIGDEELIHLCQLKKREGQQLLFERYKRKVMGICLRYAKSNMEADDILQESFIRIYKSLENTSSKGILSLEGWIVRITINTAINCLTANQRNQLNNTVELDQVSNLTFKNETPLDELNRDDLLKLIQALPTGYRLVFNLYVIEGYDHQEIAKQLNITESSSRSQLTRSKIWLKERLNTSSEKKIFRYEKFG